MERFFDLVFSSLALVILSPLLIPIIVILRLSGEGEIFFLQDRVGKNGKVFKLFKFATMLKDSPNIGSGTLTIKNDPRILPVGKLLRKTKINELPQLLNIFFGDMSLIGPRPLAIQNFNSYSKEIQNTITLVRPGLSGIGSIIFRNEEEIIDEKSSSIDFYNNSIAPYKGALEKWFVLNKGIFIYFLSIFATIWAVLFPKTKLAWKLFKDLPEPPNELKEKLHYSN
jgi:lipopolysaccharide/colanic/teichoic acid biosynthesis glycosyltransferase